MSAGKHKELIKRIQTLEGIVMLQKRYDTAEEAEMNHARGVPNMDVEGVWGAPANIENTQKSLSTRHGKSSEGGQIDLRKAPSAQSSSSWEIGS